MNRKLKKISAFAAAAVLAAGVCSAVPAEGDISQLSVSAAEAKNSGEREYSVAVYGTSKAAVIYGYFGGDKCIVYLYNDKTKKYEKYSEGSIPFEGIKITGLEANTTYKVKLAFFDTIKGKSVKTGFASAEFTTRENPRGKTVESEDGTELSPKKRAYRDLQSENGLVILPKFDKTYLIADDGKGLNVYGCLSNQYMIGYERKQNFYTYIVHGGTTDILPKRQTDSLSESIIGVQYIGDIDGDNEPEVVSALPHDVYVSYLSVYDKDTSGHYKEHRFPMPGDSDHKFEELMNENLKCSLDTEKSSYTFSSLNSDAVYTGSTVNEWDTITEISFDARKCDFYIDEAGRIYMDMFPEPATLNSPHIISEVIYDGKNFSLKNTRFEDQEQ